jgi:hypothetical protein
MMRTKLAALGAALGLALGASQAHATHFAGSWAITNYAHLDPALVVQLTATSGTFDFTLAADDPGTAQREDQFALNLFKIYTNESSLESDDYTKSPIELQFTFNDPSPNQVGSISGVTGGYYLVFSGGGYLDWAGPGLNGSTDLTWGPNHDGLLSIGVNGGTYNPAKCPLIVCSTGLQKGPSKALTVQAVFDWDRDASGAVPEPASWALMIGGFGLAGSAMRRKRSVHA